MTNVAENIENKIKLWLLSKALKKGVKSAVAFIMSYAASVKVAPILQQYGVNLDSTQLEVGLTALGTTGIIVALDWVKHKIFRS